MNGQTTVPINADFRFPSHTEDAPSTATCTQYVVASRGPSARPARKEAQQELLDALEFGIVRSEDHIRDHRFGLTAVSFRAVSYLATWTMRVCAAPERAREDREVGSDDPKAKPPWQIALEIGASVPDEEWAKLPSDLARNLDHYLYGAPKDEEE